MTTSGTDCFFHDRKYASTTQRIFNLLRAHLVNPTTNFNKLAKEALCKCAPSSNRKTITNEQLDRQKQLFDELHTKPWFEQVNHIIETNIIKICDDRLSLHRLYRLICEIEQQGKNSHLTSSIPKSKKTRICHRMELNLSTNDLGHVLGRGGTWHQTTMQETNTRIHFENAPFSLSSKTDRCPEFDLELFQSPQPLQAKITGNKSGIEKAIEAMKKREQYIQKRTQKQLENNEIVSFIEWTLP